MQFSRSWLSMCLSYVKVRCNAHMFWCSSRIFFAHENDLWASTVVVAFLPLAWLCWQERLRLEFLQSRFHLLTVRSEAAAVEFNIYKHIVENKTLFVIWICLVQLFITTSITWILCIMDIGVEYWLLVIFDFLSICNCTISMKVLL